MKHDNMQDQRQTGKMYCIRTVAYKVAHLLCKYLTKRNLGVVKYACVCQTIACQVRTCVAEHQWDATVLL